MGKQVGKEISWNCGGCEAYTMNCPGHIMRARSNSVNNTIEFWEFNDSSDKWEFVDSFREERWDAMFRAYQELK